MRFSRYACLLFFLAIAFLAVAKAQDEPVTSEDGDNVPSTTEEAGSTATNEDDSQTTASSADPTESEEEDSPSSTEDSDSSSTDASTDSPVTAAPSPTTGGGAGVITGAPTLTNVIPDYTVVIPDTKAAPFMQKSDFPQGTVFIAAGAVIGFFFLIILAWRGMVAYTLRRSMKKASENGYMNPIKDFGTGGVGKNMVSPFYSQGMGSGLSLDPLAAGAKGSGKGGRGSFVPQSSSSLFFSPTAGTGMQNANRGSGYLPSGYYAAGASVAGGGVAGNGRPISMTDFTNQRPQSSGYMRTRQYDESSPSLHPQSQADPSYGRLPTAGLSTTSLAKSDGRAPSAYLDDLFDLPPQQPQDRR